MNSDNIMTEKLFIKDLIFTKALPNYQIPVQTDGYKIFPCTDCGDKFLFESSYNYHINRKTLKITYNCRHCMKTIIYTNRCALLAHIRFHGFKTTTITISDIKIEMFPLEAYNLSILPVTPKPAENQNTIQQKNNICYECNAYINKCGVAFKDRVTHYMQYTGQDHWCPICMFLLPSTCALEAHLRIHFNIPPFFCPECGVHLANRVASYPFAHACKGFKMMQSATKLKCKLLGCNELFHPNNYRDHFKSHMKKLYRCSFCLEKWYNDVVTECLLCHKDNFTSYIQCPKCPKKLFAHGLVERHISYHCSNIRDMLKDQFYQCGICDVAYENMLNLIKHHINTHSSENLKIFLSKFLATTGTNKPPPQRGRKHVYHRVIKKCSKCLRSFSYRCIYENISKLPNDCPHKCTPDGESQSTTQCGTSENLKMKCFICKDIISQDWDDVKAHFAEFHKNHKLVDIQVLLPKLNKRMLPKKPRNRSKSATIKNKSNKNKVHVNKVILDEENNEPKKISRDSNVCIICSLDCESSKDLEIHMITHRDPCMAYQCLECGKCFVVKPSFSTHLLLEHNITDVEEYINKKPCYNESALLQNHNILNTPTDLPLKENQCRICREQFENPNDLEKHFRVHGMAFLMKNAHKNSTSP